MADVGPILPYYLRSIRNIDFSSGNVLGVNYIHGLLSIITFIVLLFLALLIIIVGAIRAYHLLPVTHRAQVISDFPNYFA